MSAPVIVPPDVTWAWAWVPPADGDEATSAVWEADVTAAFDLWTSDAVTALTRALPPEVRAAATTGSVGQEVAAWLRSRTVDLPPATYVAWGAAFLTPERPRFAPVVAVVELREPVAPDAGYLMDVVGARGRTEDARPPLVDYVTTDGGDGVRVTALVRGSRGEAAVRVEAALRLEPTPERGAVDVVVSTRVDELALFGLVGGGVEELLHAVAREQVDAGTPPTTRRTP